MRTRSARMRRAAGPTAAKLLPSERPWRVWAGNSPGFDGLNQRCGRDRADGATLAHMTALAKTIPLEQYFAGRDPLARTLFDAVSAAVLSIGDAEVRVTTSQIAFRRQRSFAWTWLPAQYLSGSVAPLVLTVDLDRFDTSSRWKEVVEPTLNHFMHHLELHSADDLDPGVLACLREAWAQAG